MVWIEWAWLVAGSPVHCACGDAMGVDPDLQRDQSTDEVGVQIADVALMGDKPRQFIQVAGCGRAARALGHAVGERPDSCSVDVVDEVEYDGIGVVCGVGDAEVEIEAEPSLVA